MSQNLGWLEKMNAALGMTGYPVIQLMTLRETRTCAGRVRGLSDELTAM